MLPIMIIKLIVIVLIAACFEAVNIISKLVVFARLFASVVNNGVFASFNMGRDAS